MWLGMLVSDLNFVCVCARFVPPRPVSLLDSFVVRNVGQRFELCVCVCVFVLCYISLILK